jgi:hypothetical protein
MRLRYKINMARYNAIELSLTVEPLAFLWLQDYLRNSEYHMERHILLHSAWADRLCIVGIIAERHQ